jgi:hypothetical protein
MIMVTSLMKADGTSSVVAQIFVHVKAVMFTIV